MAEGHVWSVPDNPNSYAIKVPIPSDWQCELFGITGGHRIVIRPLKGGEPNWFWRKMQYLAFGNRWIRVKR